MRINFSLVLHSKVSIELTVYQFHIKYIVGRANGIKEKGRHPWKTKF